MLLEVIARRAFQESAQLARTRRMTQLTQRLGFDLPDAFARNRERLAHFFARVLAALVQATTHLDDFFLPRRQRLQYRGSLLLQLQVDDSVGLRIHGTDVDYISQIRNVLIA